MNQCNKIQTIISKLKPIFLLENNIIEIKDDECRSSPKAGAKEKEEGWVEAAVGFKIVSHWPSRLELE